MKPSDKYVCDSDGNVLGCPKTHECFAHGAFRLKDHGERLGSQEMEPIKIAIVGVGNCASALVQGLYYYRTRTGESFSGLMHWDIGGYKPFDIEVTAAFDIDERKVGQDVSRAIFAPPNCATRFHEDVPETGVQVLMGRVLDGFPESMEGMRRRIARSS